MVFIQGFQQGIYCRWLQPTEFEDPNIYCRWLQPTEFKVSGIYCRWLQPTEFEDPFPASALAALFFINFHPYFSINNLTSSEKLTME